MGRDGRDTVCVVSCVVSQLSLATLASSPLLTTWSMDARPLFVHLIVSARRCRSVLFGMTIRTSPLVGCCVDLSRGALPDRRGGLPIAAPSLSTHLES